MQKSIAHDTSMWFLIKVSQFPDRSLGRLFMYFRIVFTSNSSNPRSTRQSRIPDLVCPFHFHSKRTFGDAPRGLLSDYDSASSLRLFPLLHRDPLIILDNFIVIMFRPSPLASLPLASRFILCPGHPGHQRHDALRLLWLRLKPLGP
jgi:hypothetical protein